MNNQVKYIIRTYQEGDEDQLFELRKAVFPDRQLIWENWLKSWRWKYQECPWGSRTWLADDNGRIASQHSVWIMNLKVGDDVIKVAQLVDAATRPDYRRKGIWLNLLTNGISECENTSIPVTIAFPNEASYSVEINTGFFDVPGMQKIIRIYRWDSALKKVFSNKLLLKLLGFGGKVISSIFFHVRKAPHIEGLVVSRVSSFDERIDRLWDKVCSQFPIMMVRSKDYLNWRYVAVPDVDYSIFIAERSDEVCGYLVQNYRQNKQQKVAVIYDILAESQEVAQNLISAATEQSYRDGNDYTYWVGNTSKVYLKAFRKAGFFRQFRAKPGKFLVYSNNQEISKDFLSDHQNWLIQIGDSDQL